MAKMTKTQLIDAIAEGTQLSKNDVKSVIEYMATVGYKELNESGEFVIPGFVKMSVVNKPATEARMGVAPAVAIPYVTAAIGGRACRRYALTGERFDAREALRLGLVHGVVAADKLAAARDHLVEACLKGAPKAQSSAKDLVRVAAETPPGPDLMRLTALRLAEEVVAEDAREGIAAAAEKRKAAWSA